MGLMNDPRSMQALSSVNRSGKYYLFYSQPYDGRQIITLPTGPALPVGFTVDQFILNFYNLFQEISLESVYSLHSRVLLGHNVSTDKSSLEWKTLNLIGIVNGAVDRLPPNFFIPTS